MSERIPVRRVSLSRLLELSPVITQPQRVLHVAGLEARVPQVQHAHFGIAASSLVFSHVL